MRDPVTFELANVAEFKERLLGWAARRERLIWLDSNDHRNTYSSFDALLAFDPVSELAVGHSGAFEKLKAYRAETKDWLFGYFSYDLKNAIETLSSDHGDGLLFPELFFFRPRKIVSLNKTKVTFHYLEEARNEVEPDMNTITSFVPRKDAQKTARQSVHIRMRIFKDRYFEQVKKLLSHIHRGDIYEANFCQEFYSENNTIDPLETFKCLNAISRPPFAVYLRWKDKFLLCASPERYLKKKDRRLISQPIKGTARRSKDPAEDLQLKSALENDPKERAENIMIVDLVRNDLSKSAVKGSVKVKELCKVYSFDQVHQMISTVSSEVPANADPVDLIMQTFPMGSMTGAPKISAMQIIERLEERKRGLYSGAVGYFTPDGDFDFNVVIRSILYNQTEKYISYSVGSAITAKASPEKEYEECLLKARAMKEVLENG